VALNYNIKNKAFSLLELIIAIAVLSTGIIALLRAFSFSARLTGLSCDIINAVFLAEDKMQELELKEKQNLIDNEPAQVGDREGKFAWEYTLSLNRDFNLYRLDFDIKWQRANRDESLKLNTFLRQ